MATITLKGNPIHTVGQLPKVGTQAPEFTGVKADLSESHLGDYKGKKVILNIFPSLDTPTCSLTVKKFNAQAMQTKNTVILCVSCDLPFAQKRFCGADNLNDVITLSMFRHPEFGQAYGVTIMDGPLKTLFSRAVVLIDESGKVIYTQQIPEIADEPNYQAVLALIN